MVCGAACRCAWLNRVYSLCRVPAEIYDILISPRHPPPPSPRPPTLPPLLPPPSSPLVPANWSRPDPPPKSRHLGGGRGWVTLLLTSQTPRTHGSKRLGPPASADNGNPNIKSNNGNPNIKSNNGNPNNHTNALPQRDEVLAGFTSGLRLGASVRTPRSRTSSRTRRASMPIFRPHCY